MIVVLRSRYTKKDWAVSPSVKNSNLRTGTGTCNGSFGELVQGFTEDGRHFLVTLPVNLYSIVSIEVVDDNQRHVYGGMKKTRYVIEKFLTAHKMIDSVQVQIQSELPIGKGLSSSSADQVAALRALADAYSMDLGRNEISELLARIEPHDALHYEGITAYHQREGELIYCSGYTPAFRIAMFDFGGEVDTVQVHQQLHYPDELTTTYTELLNKIISAADRRDDLAIAQISTRAARLHASVTKDAMLARVIDRGIDAVDAMGAVTTHTGTCVGLLFPQRVSPDQIMLRCSSLAEQTGAKLSVTETASTGLKHRPGEPHVCL